MQNDKAKDDTGAANKLVAKNYTIYGWDVEWRRKKTPKEILKKGFLWIPDWLGYFAQICLLSKPEERRITFCYF